MAQRQGYKCVQHPRHGITAHHFNALIRRDCDLRHWRNWRLAYNDVVQFAKPSATNIHSVDCHVARAPIFILGYRTVCSQASNVMHVSNAQRNASHGLFAQRERTDAVVTLLNQPRHRRATYTKGASRPPRIQQPRIKNKSSFESAPSTPLAPGNQHMSIDEPPTSGAFIYCCSHEMPAAKLNPRY
jgi:hypothetical protein